MNQEGSTYSIKPKYRKTKNFLYKQIRYPINFDLLIKNSDYFYQNEKSFKKENDIEIELPIEIQAESLQNFILCCENQPFQITDSNVFQLNLLSIKYKVTELTQITNQYISENHEKLVFESIVYKSQFQQSDSNLVDFSAEEDIIASHLIETIENDQLLALPVPSLDRILKKYLQNSNNFLNKNEEPKIIEFLFKCLEKYKRDASVLFMIFDFSKRLDVTQRLINDFSDTFDFNLLNAKSQIKTISDLLNEFSKLKCEYEICLQEKKLILNEFGKLKTEVDQIKIENKNFKEKMLNEFSFLLDNYNLIPIGQKWQENSATQCTIQYKGTTIEVNASSTYGDHMGFCPSQLFNGENEQYHNTRWACKPEQKDNHILIRFSSPVRANALIMTAANYHVFEAPKVFEVWAFNNNENEKIMLHKMDSINWISNMKKVFCFVNLNSYSNYKIILKSPNSKNGVIAFAELNLADIPL